MKFLLEGQNDDPMMGGETPCMVCDDYCRQCHENAFHCLLVE